MSPDYFVQRKCGISHSSYMIPFIQISQDAGSECRPWSDDAGHRWLQREQNPNGWHVLPADNGALLSKEKTRFM